MTRWMNHEFEGNGMLDVNLTKVTKYNFLFIIPIDILSNIKSEDMQGDLLEWQHSLMVD